MTDSKTPPKKKAATKQDGADAAIRLGASNPVTRHKDLMARAEQMSVGLQHLRAVSGLTIIQSFEDEKAMAQLIGSLVQNQWRVLRDAAELEASLNENNPDK